MAGPTFPELFTQALKDVEGGYDLLAAKFDQSRYITPKLLLSTFFERLNELIPAPASAIDLGCGTGAATAFLADYCTHSIVAFDLSGKMLEKCREKMEKITHETAIEYVKGDMSDLPFKNTFDLAVSFGTFGHIRNEDEEKLIRNISNALKPGGYFCFITTGRYAPWRLSLWYQRAFNILIRIRNMVVAPPFIMYYLTFRLPEIKAKLERNGFRVTIIDPFMQNVPGKADLVRYQDFKMVLAQRGK